jgi:ureidoglycolate amidohydrolase
MIYRLARITVANVCVVCVAVVCCAGFGFQPDSLQVNTSRVIAQLEELSKFNDADLPAVTRVLFSQRDVEARAYLRQLIADADLVFREDAVGNIFARFRGRDSSGLSGAAVVGTGSHYDAIPESGKYDGTVGVLGGLEAVRALRDAGFRPCRPIELLAFTSEEPTRFGKSCIGSRLLVGQLGTTELYALRDKNGVAFDDARTSAGLSGNLDSVLLPEDYYHAFVELHIEQGKVLEQEGCDIGAFFYCSPQTGIERTANKLCLQTVVSSE